MTMMYYQWKFVFLPGGSTIEVAPANNLRSSETGESEPTVMYKNAEAQIKVKNYIPGTRRTDSPTLTVVSQIIITD